MLAPTAILLFSRTAAAEATGKRYAQRGDENVRVATALIDRTRRTLDRTDLPVYHIDESGQRGHDFGTRLAVAVSEVFGLGHQHVIVVGNDCPSLTSRHLAAAARRLAEGVNVLGADRRGGAYLIGLTAASFQHERFAALDWQTAGLFDQLCALGEGAVLLPSLADINTLDDLRRAWSFLGSRLSVLGDVVMSISNWFEPLLTRLVGYAGRVAGRGPPVVG